MLESDWLTNILRCAIIFRETHGERSSRQLLTALHDHITSPNDFCYFKGLTTSSPSLQNKDPGDGVGSTSRGWRLVGLGVGMGGFRDQGVETGRFRSM